MAELAGMAEGVPGSAFLDVVVTVMRNSDGQLSQLMRLDYPPKPEGVVYCSDSHDGGDLGHHDPSKAEFCFFFDTNDLPLRAGAATGEGQRLRPGSLLFMDHCDDPADTQLRNYQSICLEGNIEAGTMRWGSRLHVSLCPCGMLRRKQTADGDRPNDLNCDSSDGAALSVELTRDVLPEVTRDGEGDDDPHSAALSTSNSSLGSEGSYCGVILRPKLRWALMRWEWGNMGNNGTEGGPSNLLRLLEHGLVWK